MAISINGITNLQTLENISESDKLLVLRNDSYTNQLFSLIGTVAMIPNSFLFRTNSKYAGKIESLKAQVDKAVEDLKAISSDFAKKDDVSSTYAKKTAIDNSRPSWLSETTKEQILANYAVKNDILADSAEARRIASQYADEMTDFAAAAMVGILQQHNPPVSPDPNDGNNGNSDNNG